MNTSDKISISPIKVILTFAALISTAEAKKGKNAATTTTTATTTAAATGTCTTDCCWVAQIWRSFGKTHLPAASDKTGCCNAANGITGVTCSRSTVTSLAWTNQNLIGPIPSMIGQLRDLQILQLEGNQLTGSIPTEIGQLTSLAGIYLDRNKLNGTIPSVVGRLKSLVVLGLGGNQLSGTIPSEIGNMTNLLSLGLGDNKLTGTIPTAIGNMSSLLYLHLEKNQLTGTIPSQIGQLKTLLALFLVGNQLTGTIPPAIGQLKSLQQLFLANNQLTGPIPTAIGNMSSLLYLHLDGNQLSGTIPSQIGQLTKLENIFLYSNQLTGTIPTAIGGMASLKYILLSSNPGLSGSFTPSNCQLTAYLPESITLCGCTSQISPPSRFPPAGTPDSCLATGIASPLAKRIQVFSTNIGTYRYTCNTDSDDVTKANPFQDCLNYIFKICNQETLSRGIDQINFCKTGVDTIFSKLSPFWQNYRRDCGKWSFYGKLPITDCNTTSVALMNSPTSFFKAPDGTPQGLSDGLLRTINLGLWSNPLLQR